MADKSFTIERHINAPVEKVWKALTDSEDLKKWLPFALDFKPKVGFHTEFMLGLDAEHQYLHHVKVTEVVANQKLSYTWDYGGMSPNSRVSFELFAAGDQTRLVLTCYVDPLPDDQPDFLKNASEGWNYTADELKKFVEQT